MTYCFGKGFVAWIEGLGTKMRRLEGEWVCLLVYAAAPKAKNQIRPHLLLTGEAGDDQTLSAAKAGKVGLVMSVRRSDDSEAPNSRRILQFPRLAVASAAGSVTWFLSHDAALALAAADLAWSLLEPASGSSNPRG